MRTVVALCSRSLDARPCGMLRLFSFLIFFDSQCSARGVRGGDANFGDDQVQRSDLHRARTDCGDSRTAVVVGWRQTAALSDPIEKEQPEKGVIPPSRRKSKRE
jgi:hypothetical protein